MVDEEEIESDMEEVEEEKIESDEDSGESEIKRDDVNDEIINKPEENIDKKQEDFASAKSSEPNINPEIHIRQEKQIRWAVVLMVGLLVIVLAVPFINEHFIDSFDYGGLKFQKTQLGDLIFYSTRFPVVSLTGNVIGDYAMNLRKDPRELEYVFINVSDDVIKFSTDGRNYGPAYITLNPFMEICEDSGIALIELAGFLRDSGLNVDSAYTDKAYARDNNQTHRWCDTAGFDSVFVITDGEETSITEIEPHCYKIQFKDCEILESVERFILIILEEYAGRFEE